MTTHLTPMPPTSHAAIRDLLVDEVFRDGAERAPRRTIRRPALALAATLTATAAVGAIALVVVDPAVEASYASWTAVPDTAEISPDEQESLGDWRSRCSDLGTGGIGFPGIKPPEWQPRDVVVDRRGKFVFCVDIAFGAPGEEQTLIGVAGLRADEGFGSLNTMTGVVRDEPVEMPVGDQVLVVGSGDAQPADPGVRSLSVGQTFGLAGPQVTAIVVVLANGTRVTATIGHGRWGAWWPDEKGSLDGAVLEVRSGKSVRTVGLGEVTLSTGQD